MLQASEFKQRAAAARTHLRLVHAPQSKSHITLFKNSATDTKTRFEQKFLKRENCHDLLSDVEKHPETDRAEV